MVAPRLSEGAPAAAHVLVVGVGGGLELVSPAAAQPGVLDRSGRSRTAEDKKP
jgi:hypothetical protein